MAESVTVDYLHEYTALYQTNSFNHSDDLTSVSNDINGTTVSNTSNISASVAPAALQFSLGVVGNLSALILLAKNTKVHKWRPFYRLVCGLVLTDFSAILLIFPFVIARYATNFTFIYSDELCNFLSFVSSATPLSSAMIVATMSTERFVAVLFPFHYATRDRKRQTTIVLACIWMTSGLICSLHLFGVGEAHLFYPGTWCFFDFHGTDVEDRVNAMMYCVAGTITLIATVVLNVCVVVYLLRRYQCSKENKERKDDGHDNLIYTIGMLMAIVIIFIVCWVPILVRIFMSVALASRDDSADVLGARLAITNSILDPWVYILIRRDVFKVIFKWIRCRGAGRDTKASKVHISMASTGRPEEPPESTEVKESRESVS